MILLSDKQAKSRPEKSGGFCLTDRSDWIRTSGPHVPNVVLYHLSHTPRAKTLYMIEPTFVN